MTCPSFDPKPGLLQQWAFKASFTYELITQNAV